jgi:hypothetical protein
VAIARFCERGNERLGSMKVGEFLNQQSDISITRRALLHGFSLYDYIYVYFLFKYT